MKELSIEEKAKAYDEALEKARLVLQERGDEPDGASMLANLFPELAESEDERIRKELINFCKIAATGQSSILIEDANQFNRWAAWLEKQGESYTKKDVDDAYLKGICDAKHELEKQGEQKQEETWPNLSNCLHDCKKCTGKCFYRKEKYQGEQKPADKVEPKFKVGQTIKKEGFNLGFTIVKIEDCFYYNDMGDYFPFTDQDNWELVEQKPVMMIQWAGDNLQEVIRITGLSPNFHKWFKSWKDYEDYVHTHNNIFKIFNEDGSHMEIPVGSWIIKAPDGYNTASRFEFVPKPAAWSEEDEKILNTIIHDLRYPGVNYYKKPIEEKVKWLKSLKDRVQLQNTWKPSKEQMLALESVCDDSIKGCIFRELLEQLKAL